MAKAIYRSYKKRPIQGTRKIQRANPEEQA